MSSHLRLVPDSPPPDYSTGYMDGLKDGEKWANRGYFGLGFGVAVVVMAAVIFLFANP